MSKRSHTKNSFNNVVIRDATNTSLGSFREKTDVYLIFFTFYFLKYLKFYLKVSSKKFHCHLPLCRS